MSNYDDAVQQVYHIARNLLELDNELSKRVATRVVDTLDQNDLITPDVQD